MNEEIEENEFESEDFEQVLRPKGFDDFKGQDQIVDNLKVFIKNSWISPIKIRLIKFKFQKAIITCDENEPIYKIKIYKKSNKYSTRYKLEVPDIDNSEPLYNLVSYISKSITENQNPIFAKNFNASITKVLEKI